MNIAVVYWSGTGNTQMMADAVAEGAGVQAQEVTAVSASEIAGFDGVALGCPAMGAEVLEEVDFEPFFTELESSLKGKKVALFGSYGWGDGQWMRDWQDRCVAAGATLCAEPVIAQETPDGDALDQCRALGKALAQ